MHYMWAHAHAHAHTSTPTHKASTNLSGRSQPAKKALEVTLTGNLLKTIITNKNRK